MEQTISDLQEQVDAALGAEEMVENLTTKCLDLEDRVAALIEEKMDLEVRRSQNVDLFFTQRVEIFGAFVVFQVVGLTSLSEES